MNIIVGTLVILLMVAERDGSYMFAIHINEYLYVFYQYVSVLNSDTIMYCVSYVFRALKYKSGDIGHDSAV